MITGCVNPESPPPRSDPLNTQKLAPCTYRHLVVPVQIHCILEVGGTVGLAVGLLLWVGTVSYGSLWVGVNWTVSFGAAQHVV